MLSNNSKTTSKRIRVKTLYATGIPECIGDTSFFNCFWNSTNMDILDGEKAAYFTGKKIRY